MKNTFFRIYLVLLALLISAYVINSGENPIVAETDASSDIAESAVPLATFILYFATLAPAIYGVAKFGLFAWKQASLIVISGVLFGILAVAPHHYYLARVDSALTAIELRNRALPIPQNLEGIELIGVTKKCEQICRSILLSQRSAWVRLKKSALSGYA